MIDAKIKSLTSNMPHACVLVGGPQVVQEQLNYVMNQVVGGRQENTILLTPKSAKGITIDQIRILKDNLSKKGYKNEKRLIIIYEASLLTHEAANAFLKQLEEPGDNVYFILVTASIDGILPTILSRAQIFYLTDPSEVNLSSTEFDIAKQFLQTSTLSRLKLVEDISKNINLARAVLQQIIVIANKALESESINNAMKIRWINIARSSMATIQMLDSNVNTKLALTLLSTAI